MRLEVMQSLWAMRPYGPNGETADLETAIAMIAAAGFDGVAVELGAQTPEEALECAPHIAEHGLSTMLNAFPATTDDLERAIVIARAIDARFLNVIAQVFTVAPEGAAPILRDWIELARDEGVTLLFETHRWSATTDLYYTLRLMELLPEMRLTADLSHYVVEREIRIPLDPLHRSLFRRILERSDSFQGRIATRQQVQVPIHFPQHAKWLEAFEGWWEEGFRDWRARAADRRAAAEEEEGSPCVFLCELGPPEYAITDAEGRELSDRWAEALWMKERARQIWAGLD